MKKARSNDNPTWTEQDFKRACPATELLPQLKRRGKQKSPTKVPVSIRLSPEVVDFFKDRGPGWQARIDKALIDYVHRQGG